MVDPLIVDILRRYTGQQFSVAYFFCFFSPNMQFFTFPNNYHWFISKNNVFPFLVRPIFCLYSIEFAIYFSNVSILFAALRTRPIDFRCLIIVDLVKGKSLPVFKSLQIFLKEHLCFLFMSSVSRVVPRIVHRPFETRPHLFSRLSTSLSNQ